MDMRSLYTSIPNNEGITATKKIYDSYIHKTIPTIINNNYISDNKLIININIRFAKNVKNYSGKHSITKCVE